MSCLFFTGMPARIQSLAQLLDCSAVDVKRTARADPLLLVMQLGGLSHRLKEAGMVLQVRRPVLGALVLAHPTAAATIPLNALAAQCEALVVAGKAASITGSLHWLAAHPHDLVCARGGMF
jgi:hypothetical protein